MKAVIEMPMGIMMKIELKDGRPVVDRELNIPVPAHYGFVPGTLAEDGDALDIFVVSNKFIQTSDELDVEVIGIFECTDQGVADHKLFAKSKHHEMSYNEMLSNMVRIGNYLLNYKPGFKVDNYRSLSDNERNELIERYRK